jgi:hypothetical protein
MLRELWDWAMKEIKDARDPAKQFERNNQIIALRSQRVVLLRLREEIRQLEGRS